MFFIKPSFINKIAVKSATQLETCKDTHDGFTILINIPKEVLPQVGNYGALIDPLAEFDKFHIVKNTTYYQLASRRIIAKRVLSYCKDDFPPKKIDKIFLEQLSKCVNYDVQANIELAKLNSHISSMAMHSICHVFLMLTMSPDATKLCNATMSCSSNLGSNMIHQRATHPITQASAFLKLLTPITPQSLTILTCHIGLIAITIPVSKVTI